MKYILIPAIYILLSIIILFNCVGPNNREEPFNSRNINIFNLFKAKNPLTGKTLSSLTWGYEYDEKGLITKVIDPGGKGTKLAYQFYPERDIIKRIEKRTGDGLVTYSYNELGQPVEMEDNYGKTGYTYDQVGNLSSVSRDNQSSISYTYNTFDQVTSISLSSGQYIKYHYDFLGRMAKMETSVGEIIYNYFTRDGIVVRQLPNGIRTQYKYLPKGKLESIIHIDKENYIITRFTYSYNSEGLISSIVEWTPQGEYALKYEYDQVQRLIVFIDRDGSKTEYAYDEFGNRTEVKVNGAQTETYSYDGLGRLLTRNGVKCEFDNSGNLLTDKDGKAIYSYNNSNKLKTAGNISYEYDGDGLLISRNESGKKTRFVANPLSDIWQPVLAKSDDHSETFYIWEGNTPVATIKEGKATFFLGDHLGSVRGITDENGNTFEQINYSPFGIPDKFLPLSGFKPGFAGLFYESETQLYLARARAYDPNSSRFLQIDPLHHIPSGTQKDLSLFAYCGGDPINFFDRIGQQAKPVQDVNIFQGFTNWLINSGPFWQKKGRDEVAVDIWQRAFYYNDNGQYKYDPDIHNAWARANTWREGEIRYRENLPDPQGFINSYLRTFSDYIDKNMPLPNSEELRNVENSLQNQRNTERQDLMPLVVEKIPKKLSWAADIEYPLSRIDRSFAMTAYWSYKHVKGEFFGGGNPFSDRDWQPQTRSTWNMQILGIFRGHIGLRPHENITLKILSNIKSNLIQFIRDHSSQIDELKSIINIFEVREAWGDEINPSLNRYYNLPSSYPSNVGGVYLGGAGKSFEGLGQLRGIVIDESNGKLVLISEDQGTIELPPLRLDDVVTVFQSVYRHGEAPFVSIDPDPLNPKGPIMNTRHGESTNDTYVGWVLFETDRIMKAYSLGEDNISKESVKSGIDGYDEVLENMFTGNSDGNNWERFWIVPDKIEKNMSGEKSLTMMNVPLKVNTQKMVMQNGKLETDLYGKSSKGAEAFSSWFTENYDKIADEVTSLPPAGSGFTAPVPVFRELQRIALITAIAEQLRDQGIVYPFWMRGYEVKKFPIPKTTPSHTVTRQNGNMILSIFGGVDLSAPDDQVYIKALSPSENKLAQMLNPLVRVQPYFEPVSVEIDNIKYKASVLPGSDTKDLGASVLNETDLSVPIIGGYFLSITRKFNSFIAPTDKLFGKTWTLDLPFLEEQKIPYMKSDDRVQYRIQYHLISPLNNYYKKIETLFAGSNNKIGTITRMVSFQDGTNLHFNEKGYLVAYEEGPVLIFYNRDATNNIFQIVGFYGQNALADIKLKYDNNRLIEAKGSNGDMVKYVYSEGGYLLQALYSEGDQAGQHANPKNNIFYEYQNNLVTTIKYNDDLNRRFNYNEKGQLIGEVSPGNQEISYNITADQNGSKIFTFIHTDVQKIKEEKKSFLSWLKSDRVESSKENSSEELKESIQYDASFRPVKWVSKDGPTTDWDYSDKEFNIMEITPSLGDKFQIKQSKDGRKITYSFPGGVEYEENYNEAGQLLDLKKNNVLLYKQKWNQGILSSIEFENSKMNYEYDEDGIFKRTLITPPGDNTTLNQWVEYRYDKAGNLTGVADFTGMRIEYEFCDNGELSSIISNQGKVDIKRNNGLMEEIKTSWGDETKYYYNTDGQILEIQNTSFEGKSAIKFADDRISEILRSSGSKYSLRYYPQTRNHLIKRVKTPLNDFEYFYDDNDQLINVLCNKKYQVKYVYDEFGRMRDIQISSLKL